MGIIDASESQLDPFNLKNLIRLMIFQDRVTHKKDR